MKMIPVVVVVEEGVRDALLPVIDQIAASISEAIANDGRTLLTLRLNGWTPEMIAWGRLLKAAAENGVEIER